ncbi:MaoC family dehydratase N-terminal domain-containing protein [Pseudomonas lurida]|uniref:MaoC family dehydratase N-terminal domain-containing protein n=1 Tax=Pseudomonas lurida TaxID=244566 RepID=UPI0016493121|nr:MaoC family dehydratase N-terminal domain-containing protein [Pseudomonas lurida]MBC3244979.1 MaoC family dehydratase N-terminal domain-containing protein [Pseudomonas lurida]
MTQKKDDEFASWIGKTQTSVDQITRTPMSLLAATLDREQSERLQVPWSWFYFLPHTPTEALGVDGHPLRQGFLPPITLPRRMWAGSRIETTAIVPRVGDSIRRISTIRSIERKRGFSGELIFLGLEHQVTSEAGLLLREQQDLVYRDAPARGVVPAPGKVARTDAKWSRDVVPTSTLLMRFSALTFNAHRIHYDFNYATQEEGYPGLVVHGPLIATLLLDLVYRHLPDIRVKQFTFRAVRPLFANAPFKVCASLTSRLNQIDLWACDSEGFVTTEASLAYQ